MTLFDLSTGETQLLVIFTIVNLLTSAGIGLILFVAIQRSGDERALAEHERWKNYLNAEYARILGESEINQQEIQALVAELRGIADLLRGADITSLLPRA